MGLGLAATLARAEPVGLAVVEDVGFYAGQEHRDVYEPRVRALFVKNPAGWRLACKSVSPWNPTCEAQDFPPFAQLHDFIHDRPTVYRANGFQNGNACYDEGCNSPAWLDISPENIQLGMEDRLNVYSGMNFQPARKPRPVTSMDQPVRDPEGWKSTLPVPLTPVEQGWLIKRLSELMICAKGEAPPLIKIDLKIAARHLKVDRRYANKRGGSIQLVTVTDHVSKDCARLGGVGAMSYMHQPWFMLVRAETGESARYALLGHISERDSTYRTIFAAPDLIQFGDFDGDGKSEALFHLRSYQERGYLLLHQDMLKQVRFSYGGN